MERLFLPWQIYWLSLTDVLAYPWLALRPARLKILTLVAVYGVLAAISTGHFSVVTLPQWQSGWQEAWDKTREGWPENVSLRYENGILNTVPEEPLVIPYPSLFPRQSGWPEYLARIDVTAAADEPQDGLLFLNRDTLTTRTAASGGQSAPLADFFGETSWTLDRSSLLQADPQVNRLLTEAGKLLIAGWLGFHWLGLLAGRLIGLLLYAWITQTIFKLMGVRIRYGHAYGLGMILLLPAETLQTLVNILYPQPLPLFWWAWLGMALLVGWLNRRRFSEGDTLHHD